MMELYYCLMAICCLIWIYLNSDTLTLQWHNKQRGVNFWLNVALMINASILAFMLVTEVMYNVVFLQSHFVIIVANLFMLYTIRKILRRMQLKRCGKDFHKTQCNLQAIAFSKSGMLLKIFNS